MSENEVKTDGGYVRVRTSGDDCVYMVVNDFGFAITYLTPDQTRKVADLLVAAAQNTEEKR